MLPVAGCDSRYQDLINSRRNILYETEDFVVLPSLGPLNDAHAMIVPKQHLKNFSIITDEQLHQVENIVLKMSTHIFLKTGKRLSFFESGAGKYTYHSGGCVVHAHIHCVYESDDFHQRLMDEVVFKEVSGGWFNGGNSQYGYVWFRGSNGRSFICNNPELPSQFLRYVYSAAAGDIRFWNWRRHNNIEGVLRVIENYSDMDIGVFGCS
ncbi:HIT family protein [Pseudomonas sp. WC2]|uniref:HIT family protein n=1 Tax=Pseudomonas sp. WC2 TaxID=3424773 RepID=UPI003D356AEA